MKKKSLLLFFLVIVLLSQVRMPANAQSPSERPVIAIDSYSTDITPARGETFSITIGFLNLGQITSTNLMIEFIPGDLIPRDTGGFQTIYQLIKGEKKNITQTFTVSPDLWGASIANTTVNINYSDYDGNLYSDSFILAIDLRIPPYVVPTPTPTPTPAPMLHPQLVIQSFSTDEAILQPGTILS